MNISSKLIVMGSLLGLVGCISGPKPRDPEPNNPSSVKSAENQLPPPVTRITPDEINEGNARAKATELERIISAELEQPTEK